MWLVKKMIGRSGRLIRLGNVAEAIRYVEVDDAGIEKSEVSRIHAAGIDQIDQCHASRLDWNHASTNANPSASSAATPMTSHS